MGNGIKKIGKLVKGVFKFMTGKDLIEWIKENNAEEMLVITPVNDWLAVEKNPAIRNASEVKDTYFDSTFQTEEKVIFI